jgi:hypothetical protein
VAQGHAELGGEAGIITESGVHLLSGVGIDVGALTPRRTKGVRVLCRPCLDWSERRPHLGGAVGAAICSESLARGWVARMAGTRAVAITPLGGRMFRDAFGATID